MCSVVFTVAGSVDALLPHFSVDPHKMHHYLTALHFVNVTCMLFIWEIEKPGTPQDWLLHYVGYRQAL